MQVGRKSDRIRWGDPLHGHRVRPKKIQRPPRSARRTGDSKRRVGQCACDLQPEYHIPTRKYQYRGLNEYRHGFYITKGPEGNGYSCSSVDHVVRLDWEFGETQNERPSVGRRVGGPQ